LRQAAWAAVTVSEHGLRARELWSADEDVAPLVVQSVPPKVMTMLADDRMGEAREAGYFEVLSGLSPGWRQWRLCPAR
jgi:hypothetical protein